MWHFYEHNAAMPSVVVLRGVRLGQMALFPRQLRCGLPLTHLGNNKIGVINYQHVRSYICSETKHVRFTVYKVYSETEIKIGKCAIVSHARYTSIYFCFVFPLNYNACMGIMYVTN